MNAIKKLILIFSFIISGNLFAGTIDPHTPDSKYIEFGKDFKYVYKICGTYDGEGLFCASSVAIDPHWILTAAHVVKGAKICIVYQEEKAFLVNQIFVHEDFNDGKFGFNDIALCYIDEDLGLNFYPPLNEDNNEVGKTCTMSGYGCSGTFSTGANFADNIRRGGSNKIDSVDRDLLICSPSLNNKTELEFMIATGDSGGGLFIGNKLAGINSCVIAVDKLPNSTYGDECGHTRVSKYVDWIKNKMKNHKPEIKSILLP